MDDVGYAVQGDPLKLIGGSARRIWAVGALTMGMLVAGAGVAAAGTADTARFRVTAGPLVLSHDGSRYTGTMRLTVRNIGGAPADGATMLLGVPPGLRFLGVSDGGGCMGGNPWGCALFTTLAPGERTTFTVSFGGYAAPARHARVTGAATVTVTPNFVAVGASATYAGVLRGTSGTLRHPRPYHPGTTYDAVIGAGTPLLEPDGAGGYAVRIPLTVRNRTDADNDGAAIWITGPAGTGFPSVDPPGICMSGCEVPGGWLAAREIRSFAALFTFQPTGPGPYRVTIRTAMNSGGERPDATPDDNVVTVDLNIA
jgi:hypothetical protein